MWLGRDEHVEPEITVRNFGPTASERPFRINQRNTALRMDSSKKKRKYVIIIIIIIIIISYP